MIRPLDKCTVGERLVALWHLVMEFHSRATQASVKATEGINALCVLIQAFQSINNLRKRFGKTDRVHGIVTQSGESPNIIPPFTRTDFHVQVAPNGWVDQLLEQVKNCARGIALAIPVNVEYSVRKEPELKTSLPNETLNEAFALIRQIRFSSHER